MEYISQIINQIINNFDFSYMFIVNVLTYIIIKIIDYLNGNAKVHKLVKIICLIISIIFVAIIYKLINYDSNIVLINSAILAPVFWSWILKPICIKFGIDYKKIDNTLC
jgi:hypothetical protein